MDIKAFLKKASMATGVAGFEFQEITRVVQEAMAGLVDEVRVDTLGNVIGYRRGEGDGQRPKVMLCAHMDEIGLIVTKIEEGGFLRFSTIGGIDPRVLPGHEVLVHGRKVLPGVIGAKPPHITSPEEAQKAHKVENLFIDVGLPTEKVKELVRVGDVATYRREFTELMGDLVSGKAMDDRAGVAVLLVCLEELRRYRVGADVYCVMTSQEETGLKGARVSAYSVTPDIGIAVDVDFGESPGVPEWQAAALGKGPSISRGGNVHPKVYDALDRAAREMGIPIQAGVVPGASGTDAWAIQMTKEGVATGIVGIPLRYMHTSVETLSVGDVEKAGALLARFVASVDAAFVKELVIWN